MISACGTYRQTQKPLLKKNKIVVHGSQEHFDVDEIENLVAQDPNKSILGIWKFKLWAYQLANRGKERRIKQWMHDKFGEPPVFYDAGLTTRSIRQMTGYMNKTGHFDANVWEEKIEKKRKIKLKYHVEPGIPYRINAYDYKVSDTTILNMIKSIETYRLMNVGDVYNAFTMHDERDRITAHLRNNGYYKLTKEYFYYEVDSTFAGNNLSITLVLKNPESQDAAKGTQATHQRYTINNVLVNSNYDLLRKDYTSMDTVNVEVADRDTSKHKVYNYQFLFEDEFRIKPKAITNALTLRSEDYFSQEKIRNSYRRLAEMRTFKYTSIQFDELNQTDSLGNKLLDVNIDLARAPMHSYSVEVEGTYSGGDLGIGGNLTYTNKNLFKGAEIFQIRFKTKLEDQQLATDISNKDRFLFFNTIETGVEFSLTFPKFLIPISQEFFPKNFKPRTNINTGLNYQQRPNYKRYITNLSFGYEWTQGRTRHILYPVELNSVRVFPTPEFEQILEEEDNIRIRNQYINHLIPGLRYSIIYNSQNLKKLNDFVYIRGDFETSGFMAKGIHTLFNTAVNSDGNHELFGIRYSQYVRFNIDFRHYNILTEDSRFVFRTLVGFGIPYGNSTDLPFEKGFYSGGANGMRGWGIRSLGPGSSTPANSSLERIGDIRLELNMEYRFPIHNFIKGALFADIGNIWTIRENTSFVGGQFNFNDFYKEVGIDAGFGIRFDFKFFVFRFDGALRLHDPERAVGDRWVFNEISLGNVVWNFGIGYPF
ncbi:MAG: hypothetical protein CL663_06345 [Bacteroidetes bacterium]|nr:hypothetical protein [Bacteroidota bacterium]